MAYLFKAISIEDSPSDTKRLKDLLSRIDTVEYRGNASSLAEGSELLVREHPDLLFLDVDLPDGNGIEALENLRSLVTWPMKFVIYTVYDDRVLEALRKHAFDYLIKPVKHDDLEQLMHRLIDDYERRADELEQRDPNLQPSHSSIVMVNTIMGYIPIRLSDIVYAEHVDKTKYWRIHLSDGTSQLLRKGTSSITILGMNRNFMQVNNRQIINLTYLGILKKDSCTLICPTEKIEIAVTRSYATDLQKRMLFI